MDTGIESLHCVLHLVFYYVHGVQMYTRTCTAVWPDSQFFICLCICVSVHWFIDLQACAPDHRRRRDGLMVSTLDSGASAPGSSPGWGHCVVFLGKTLTLYSHGASLHPGV